VITLVGLFSYPKRKLRKLVKEGEYKEAVDFGKSLEQKNPNDSDLLFIMGGLFYILKDAETALNYFNRVLELNGYDEETLLLKADVHVFLKEFDVAIECCNKVLDVDFENMEAKNILERIQIS
jgi:tetratricopeptide (TPR) repeat protein